MAPEVLTPISVDEFWNLAPRLPKSELVAGQVIELVPPGTSHGLLVAEITRELGAHVVRSGLGIVVVETGFVLSVQPPTVRSPDVAVVLRERLPSPVPRKFFPGPPDLAVEVLSADDRPAEVASKVADYLRAGARSVWVVDPQKRTLTIHTPGGATRYVEGEVVHGADPLPGFEMSLKALFSVID
jgi:Uma2 family endonuclease